MIGAITNRTEQFHNFAQFLMIGGRLIGHNDPDYPGLSGAGGEVQ
jgi:hypothetical protein